MKDLQSLFQTCLAELAVIGIIPDPILSVEPNSRAKKRWGQARQLPGRAQPSYTIDINAQLLVDEVPDEAVKTVLIHEILHCVPGCMGHTGKWRELADRVEQWYGYEIRRTNLPEDFGLKVESTMESADAAQNIGAGVITYEPAPVRYRLVCEKCGQTIDRTRKSKLIKYPYRYRCAKCGGKFRRAGVE